MRKQFVVQNNRTSRSSSGSDDDIPRKPLPVWIVISNSEPTIICAKHTRQIELFACVVTTYDRTIPFAGDENRDELARDIVCTGPFRGTELGLVRD